MTTIGVTRLTDVTGLDRVGIPVWAAVRPIPGDSALSVQNGKGPTRMQARTGALEPERSGLMQFDVRAIEAAVRNLQMSRSIPTDSMFW